MRERKTEIEIWGGVECTVNRVADRYHDQLRRNGHLERAVEDLDKFAALGLKALRVPVLWELAEPQPGVCELARFDPMMERARALGLRVIVGLVHHGSGPMHTSLLDPEFEHGLARFAAKVSERYPWVEDYTPINEPLTTARFSGLYGHWYPHAKSPHDFVRALLHETRATIRAMAAIREQRPGARLVQTEDVGSVRSTPLLAYQAEHENQRCWLSLDLLTGKVVPGHPLYDYLVNAAGASRQELAWIAEQATAPDLIGINYYFTSDRYLDERLERYPAWSHGGNGRHAYADVDCPLVGGVPMRGHRQVIEEVWQRYRLPVAITEVHAGCTREEQLRWVHEAFRAANSARAEGVDIRALTLWSLLGSFDWSSLVTQERGVYEPGVFDLRAPAPRPTALASMARDLARVGHHEHPVLEGAGWWRRRGEEAPAPSLRARPLAIVGPHGTLGRAFVEACRVRGLAVTLLDRSQLDVTSAASIERALSALRPWAVINAAGYVRVDDAERDVAGCFAVNAQGAASLAEACRRIESRFVTFSSDLVFGGQQRTPYLESHETDPLCTYGRSKREAERSVAALHPDSLVIRTSAFFGPSDAYNFVTQTLARLRAGERVQAAADVTVSPTYVPHLTHATLELLIDGVSGLWHLANGDAVSWFELAQRAAAATGVSDSGLVPCEFRALGLPAARPAYCVLGSERGWLMPSLNDAIAEYARACPGQAG